MPSWVSTICLPRSNTSSKVTTVYLILHVCDSGTLWSNYSSMKCYSSDLAVAQKSGTLYCVNLTDPCCNMAGTWGTSHRLDAVSTLCSSLSITVVAYGCSLPLECEKCSFGALAKTTPPKTVLTPKTMHTYKPLTLHRNRTRIEYVISQT